MKFCYVSVSYLSTFSDSFGDASFLPPFFLNASLVFPCRFTSEAAMEMMGAAFQDACHTLWDYHEVLHHQMSLPGGAPA